MYSTPQSDGWQVVSCPANKRAHQERRGARPTRRASETYQRDTASKCNAVGRSASALGCSVFTGQDTIASGGHGIRDGGAACSASGAAGCNGRRGVGGKCAEIGRCSKYHLSGLLYPQVDYYHGRCKRFTGLLFCPDPSHTARWRKAVTRYSTSGW